jgi:hypothetical protein
MDTLFKVLEQFEKLGINPLYIISIVFLTVLLKSIDRKHKIKNSDVIFPLLIGLCVCWIGRPWDFQKWVMDSMTHSAVSYYASRIWGSRLRDRRK